MELGQSLRGLAIGRAKVDLRFRRTGETTRWEVLRREGDLQVREQVWGPWRTDTAPEP